MRSDRVDRFLTLPRDHYTLPNTEFPRPMRFCWRKTGRSSAPYAPFWNPNGAPQALTRHEVPLGREMPLGKFAERNFRAEGALSQSA